MHVLKTMTHVESDRTDHGCQESEDLLRVIMVDYRWLTTGMETETMETETKSPALSALGPRKRGAIRSRAGMHMVE